MSTPYNEFPAGFGEPSLPEGASMEEGTNAPARNPKTATSYIVLALNGEADWHEAGRGTATSAEAAIRAVLGEPDADTGGTYVAVPARSWKPTKVTTRVETTLALEDA